MSNIIVGLIQMEVVEDKNRNLSKASLLIQKAADEGAKIIMLPEMFNCPYESTLFPVYAETEGDISWEILSKSAKSANAYLIAGSIPELDEKKVYNTTYIFDNNGKQIGKHRKIHLFDIDVEGGQKFKESLTLAPGNDITIVETEYCMIGVGICYDIRFPELARLMANKEAKLLAFPAAFNMTTGPVHWEISFRMRALDNQVYALGCSPARNEKAKYISYANSIITNPWGEVVNKLEEKEGILIQEIDLNLIDKVRGELPLLRHIRKDLYKIIEVDR
ncbi:MAG: carbon-nitrogen hydrolase family protein [Eubacteriaceae bacterium]